MDLIIHLIKFFQPFIRKSCYRTCKNSPEIGLNTQTEHLVIHPRALHQLCMEITSPITKTNTCLAGMGTVAVDREQVPEQQSSCGKRAGAGILEPHEAGQQLLRLKGKAILT